MQRGEADPARGEAARERLHGADLRRRGGVARDVRRREVRIEPLQLDAGERFLHDADGIQPLSAAKRRLFAYVPQGNQLMSGTIREVVAFADKADMQNDERINRALHIACADDFVSELDSGIDTLLGERGTGLSEGQMQRIAIARAIFSESPILLLDEATSALDADTEKLLLKNLRSMTDKTVVIVTHRPAALEICDRVIDFTNTDGSESV